METVDLVNELLDWADVEGPGSIKALLEEAAERIELLEERIAIVQEPQWISVMDRLPEKGKTVLAAVFGHDLIIQHEGESLYEAIRRVNKTVRYVTIGSMDDDGWNGADGYPMMVQPSYWMRMPELPKEGEVG